MSIIQAYKSDTDGKIFECKARYIKHLRKLAAQRKQEKILNKLKIEHDEFINCMCQVKNLDELNQFIKDNWKHFWANGEQRERWKDRSHKASFHEYIAVSIPSLYFRRSLSNTHSCPRGGVINWSPLDAHNQGKPTGYPGWFGRIHIKIRTPQYTRKNQTYFEEGWGSSYFEGTPIYTGSGGGGHIKDGITVYEYDVKLWAADFRGLYDTECRKQWIEQENKNRSKVWTTLGGCGTVPQITDVPPDWVCPDPWL